MTRIELARQVVDDFDRIIDHLLQHDVDDASSRIGDMIQAIDVLAGNPLIGRPLPAGMRELVIGRRSRGYVALYRYLAEIDTVFILAIRSQRESGHSSL